MTVITISRQFGSGGDEIADQVCERLGYRKFNKQIIARAAVDSGLTDQEIVDFQEESYRVQNFFDRLSGRARPVSQVRVWAEDTSGVRVAQERILSEDMALALVQRAIRLACDDGNIIIVGRGGQAVLRDSPGALHVRIQAALEDRILRVQAGLKEAKPVQDQPLELRRRAQDMIELHDTASASYLKRFYNIDWSDSALYHMVLNTSRLADDLAVELVVVAARKLEPAPA